MPQCLENPEIHIWYVGGNSAVGHNILLEVDEKFYVADDMANEPMLVNMQDSDGQKYHLTRENVKKMKRLRCDKEQQACQLWLAIWETKDMEVWDIDDFTGAMKELDYALMKELEEARN